MRQKYVLVQCVLSAWSLSLIMGGGTVGQARAEDLSPDVDVTAKPDKSLTDALADGVLTDESDTPAAPMDFGTLLPKEPPSLIDLWSGRCSLGANGSEGNSQTFDIIFGFDAKRKTKRNVLSVDLDYRRGNSNSVMTAHKGLLLTRYERLFAGTPWRWFFDSTLEYNEFRDFDLRLAMSSGLGYRLIQAERTSLTGRLGGGVSHEFGSVDDQWIPELAYGLDLEHKLNERQKIVGSFDCYPDATDFTNFRVKSKISWEIVLDESMNLSMKIGAIDRYDSSTPANNQPNDFDYSVTLLWGF